MVTLLPSGGFEIRPADGSVIKGRFSAASLKKFSLASGGTEFSETLKLITENVSLQSVLKFILCACEGEYTEFDVLGWIEEMGGIDSDDSKILFGHFMDGFHGKKKMSDQT